MEFELINNMYTFVFPSNQLIKEYAVHQLLDEIKSIHAQIDLDPQELRLVIDEALTNAMEHGNHWNDKKNVVVKIKPSAEKLCISFLDEGLGFDIDQKKKDSIVKSIYNKRGRGILILSRLCNIQWNSIGNEMLISVPFSKSTSVQ